MLTQHWAGMALRRSCSVNGGGAERSKLPSCGSGRGQRGEVIRVGLGETRERCELELRRYTVSGAWLRMGAWRRRWVRAEADGEPQTQVSFGRV